MSFFRRAMGRLVGSKAALSSVCWHVSAGCARRMKKKICFPTCGSSPGWRSEHPTSLLPLPPPPASWICSSLVWSAFLLWTGIREKRVVGGDDGWWSAGFSIICQIIFNLMTEKVCWDRVRVGEIPWQPQLIKFLSLIFFLVLIALLFHYKLRLMMMIISVTHRDVIG